VSRESGSLTPGISIVCVYNDSGVLQNCLNRSIAAYSGDLDVDFIPVNNTAHAFTTAGAALNHGVRRARHSLVAFAHQDVYLHSIERLAAVGAALNDTGWGLLGANGFTAHGMSVGRMRDRVLLIGAPAARPVDVDSVDEVLFMVLRDVVLKHPFTEDPQLAWHAYAVEYGLRLRQLAMRVGAVDLAVTHNSLTINLENLDVAHRHVGELYPHLLPIKTTCGTIETPQPGWRDLPLVREHGWRIRWLRQSLQAVRVRRRISVPVVLSEICYDVDLLQFSDESPLHLINLDRPGGFAEYSSQPLLVTRYGRPVIMRAAQTAPDLLAILEEIPSTSRTLVTDLSLDDLHTIGLRFADRDWVVGFQPGAIWLLGGPIVRELPSEWSQPRAVPLGFRAAPSAILD
jgi:hypothetical protein